MSSILDHMMPEMFKSLSLTCIIPQAISTYSTNLEAPLLQPPSPSQTLPAPLTLLKATQLDDSRVWILYYHNG